MHRSGHFDLFLNYDGKKNRFIGTNKETKHLFSQISLKNNIHKKYSLSIEKYKDKHNNKYVNDNNKIMITINHVKETNKIAKNFSIN